MGYPTKAGYLTYLHGPPLPCKQALTDNEPCNHTKALKLWLTKELSISFRWVHKPVLALLRFSRPEVDTMSSVMVTRHCTFPWDKRLPAVFLALRREAVQRLFLRLSTAVLSLSNGRLCFNFSLRLHYNISVVEIAPISYLSCHLLWLRA